jgi:hypothetical protein
MVFLSKQLHIKHLSSGGLITNYYCTSKCRHCLYCCSPNWERKYIDPETTRRNFQKIKELGCHAVHVGGGEPLLNPEGLLQVLKIARELEVRVEYVETNSSWYKDQDSARSLLAELKKTGLATLLVSISPLHNEYIPFYKVKGVIEACRSTGLTPFPWISDFYKEIDALDDRVPHPLAEYHRSYGDDYLKRMPARYWIHPGGRALLTFKEVFDLKDHPSILAANRRGCSELKDVSHFHLDLFGHYIPGLCSGLALHGDDLGQAVSSQKYPLLATLFESGINGLFQLASQRYGFRTSGQFTSKCHLCLEIRRFLAMETKAPWAELQPLGFYENLG